MSLIQAIITDKYAMLCSDTKAYTLSGTHVDDCHKIIPIGNGIMFGCTGKVSDNYELFEDYCECDGVRFSSRNFETSLSYNGIRTTFPTEIFFIPVEEGFLFDIVLTEQIAYV